MRLESPGNSSELVGLADKCCEIMRWWPKLRLRYSEKLASLAARGCQMMEHLPTCTRNISRLESWIELACTRSGFPFAYVICFRGHVDQFSFYVKVKERLDDLCFPKKRAPEMFGLAISSDYFDDMNFCLVIADCEYTRQWMIDKGYLTDDQDAIG